MVMRNGKRNAIGTHGFSLVEALIATTIVIVALAGLAQLCVVAVAANQRAKSRTIATVLAQEKLEELMATNGDVASGSDFVGGRGQWLGAGDSPPPGTAYVRRWIAEPLAIGAGATRLRVAVTPAGQVLNVETAQLVAVKASSIPLR